MAMTIAYAVGSNLYVNITNKCPCSCTFCIRKNGDGVYGSDSLWLEHEPSAQEIIDALEKADFKKYDEIIFCGYGEPTERIECLAEIADYIKKNSDKKIRLNTNGLSDLIHGKDTACMLENRIDTVSISLNAPTKEKYNEITRPSFGEKSFDAMLKFAKECKEFGTPVKLTVVDVISKEDIEDCKKLCEEIGIPLRVREYTAE